MIDPLAASLQAEWFGDWLDRFCETFERCSWRRSEYAMDAVREMLAELNATKEEAYEAMKLLVRNPCYPDHYCNRLGELIRESRRSDPAPYHALPAAHQPSYRLPPSDPSHGCPLCQGPLGEGPGWVKVECHNLLRWTWVRFTCRCPEGRQKRRYQNPEHDDFQSWPQLWNPGLSHKSWDDRPTSPIKWDLPERVALLVYRGWDGACWNAVTRQPGKPRAGFLLSTQRRV